MTCWWITFPIEGVEFSIIKFLSFYENRRLLVVNRYLIVFASAALYTSFRYPTTEK